MQTSLGQALTQQTEKQIHYLPKQAVRILQPLLKNLNALNVYQINLFQGLNFMHRIKMGNIPEVFHETIKKLNHKYPTTFSNLIYSINKYSLKSTKYSVSYRGPTLWNTILDKRDKEIESHLLFKKKIKSKLLDITIEQMFFLNNALINDVVSKKSYLLGA